MPNKIVGSIVATDISTGLKTVFHVNKAGGNVTFTRPDNPEWSHVCHPINVKSSEGWEHEIRTINAPSFSDPKFEPIKKTNK